VGGWVQNQNTNQQNLKPNILINRVGGRVQNQKNPKIKTQKLKTKNQKNKKIK
jgi:hypothetical protein